MADADILITAGSGTKVDTRTVGAGTDEHRQVMVVGDPATAAAVQAVQNTVPAGTEYGAVSRAIVSGGGYTLVTGTISVTTTPPTSATGSNTTGIIVPCATAGNITFAVAGTYGANAVLKFQGSMDGTNFFDVQVARTDLPIVESTSSALPANTIRAWNLECPGYQYVRMYLSVVPASGTISAAAMPGGFLYDPSPVITQATGQGKALSFASISAASSGNNTLVAASAANKIKVVSYVLIADGSVTATFQSGAGGTGLSGAMSLTANSGVSAISTPSSHILETLAINTLLNLSLSAAVGVRGHMSYFLEP